MFSIFLKVERETFTDQGYLTHLGIRSSGLRGNLFIFINIWKQSSNKGCRTKQKQAAEFDYTLQKQH